MHCEGVKGADFPSVSLVTGVGAGGGVDFSLGDSGSHIHTVGVRVEGAALPLTQLYCHKNTASITTLSRALIERGELSYVPFAPAKTSADGSEGTRLRPSAAEATSAERSVCREHWVSGSQPTCWAAS